MIYIIGIFFNLIPEIVEIGFDLPFIRFTGFFN